MQTLGVYVQVPFCASKCSFCNFSSQVAPASAFDAYLTALEREARNLRPSYESKGIPPALLDFPVDSVYWGGGTPSLLGAERLRRLAETLRAAFRWGGAVEFTVEVSPGSADDAWLSASRALGVNRLSLGAQSFDDRELRAAGRLHRATATQEQVLRAQRAGFANISLDLIAGLPYQTEASWRHSLRQAVALEPEHISVYLFEIDEKSRLGQEVLRHGERYHARAVPDEEFMAQAYEEAQQWLAAHGYEPYEFSNFARPGYASRHNRKYWQLDPYVGLGAGAHSFDGERRWSNEASVEDYQRKLARGESPIAQRRQLGTDEQIEEFFFLGLRQRRGVDPAAAGRRWGEERLRRWEPVIASLVEEGWIERQAGMIRLPERAWLVSNEILERFLMGGWR